MTIIGVGGEKGGSGKTSFATNAAAYLASQGHSVAILDADPKPAASRWAARRKESHPELPTVEFKRATGDIDDTIKAMGQRYDYLVIDCGGMEGPEMRHAIVESDVFVVPFMPSIYDTETAEAVDKLVGTGKAYNKNLRAHSLLMAVANNRLSKTAIATRTDLEGMKNLPCVSKPIYQLDEWRHTARDGLGVIEGRNAKAKNDIRMVLEELGL